MKASKQRDLSLVLMKQDLIILVAPNPNDNDATIY